MLLNSENGHLMREKQWNYAGQVHFLQVLGEIEE
ncbi:hypothetical protein J2Z69_003457 [Paenibacillus shirakamiensis]|uniref:Uncharacterized protein n=1 Tax=Paenibacillus shirakamiensis TaxID=1265935 RepID=A0ABS4JKZ8_9BACL|nr:hypothetical protein [Paenibacillus shirakamiensis]